MKIRGGGANKRGENTKERERKCKREMGIKETFKLSALFLITRKYSFYNINIQYAYVYCTYQILALASKDSVHTVLVSLFFSYFFI